MFASIFLFVLYTILFSVCLYWMSHKKILQLAPPLAISGFLIRIGLGCLYGFIYGSVYNGDDTWRYHWLSVEETGRLIETPVSYLSAVFQLKEYSASYEMSSAWESVEFGFLIKLLAFLNLFSGGNYYVNVALFSMISFWGSYFLYRLFLEAFPDKRIRLWIAAFAFIPALFWTAGIRKDGLIFLGLSTSLYSFYQLFCAPNKKYLFGLVTGILLLILNRHLLALSLIPAAVLFVWIRQSRINLTHLLTGAVFFLMISLYFLPEKFSLLLREKRISFEALTGGSRMDMPELDGSRIGLIKSIPHAIYNVFLQPLPTISSGLLSGLSGLETFLILLAILLAVFFPESNALHRSQMALLCSLFLLCFINYAIIGMIVPFSGATVRYRAPFEAILLIAVWSLTDFRRIRNKFTLK